MTAGGWYDSHANQPDAARYEHGQLRAQHQDTLHKLAIARGALTFIADVAQTLKLDPIHETAVRALKASNPASREDQP